MRATYLEVIAKFLTDEEFRCEVLEKEETTLKNPPWNFQRKADRDILTRLDPQTILEAVVRDVKDTNRPLWKMIEDARDEIWPTAVASLESGSAGYSEGNLHLREAMGGPLKVNVEKMVTVRGQGIDCTAWQDLTVRFIPDGGDEQSAIPFKARAKPECKIDINQYVEVMVTLPKAGKWWVSASNDGSTDWSEEKVSIEVQS